MSEAKKIEYEEKKRLEQFQMGIREGAIVTISKMIFKMSIYITSKIHDCGRDINAEQIQNVLDNQVAKISELSSFYGDNRTVILHHNSTFDIQKELRPLTKNKDGAAGRLERRKNDELELIKKSLEKLKKLEKSLEIWKEGIRKEGRVESIIITDMHF